MGCEYLMTEYRKDQEKRAHVRESCAYTLEPCLIDDPLGYVQCTRRTWLMLQGRDPQPEAGAVSRKPKPTPKEQLPLI